MYAVIKTGGKQYKVQEGDTLRVEKLNIAEGEAFSFDEVLMVVEGENISVGTPLVSGASVAASVQSHGRGAKINVVRFKRRKHHRKQMGHRQSCTELKITGINTR